MVNGQDLPTEVAAWLTNIGRYEDAVRYGSLFWPTFAEMDGCVFLGPGVPDTLGEWRAKLGTDRERIEAVLNHRHILELFLGAPEPSVEVTRRLGRLLQEMWTAKLSRDFPGRQFVVTLSDGDDPEITFYTERRDG
jgi:hypothetical protein